MVFASVSLKKLLYSLVKGAANTIEDMSSTTEVLLEMYESGELETIVGGVGVIVVLVYLLWSLFLLV